MDIAFFGSSLLSAYWNGAATYYRGVLRALAGLGHRIVFYEPDAFDRQKHRDIDEPSWARVVVYPADRRAMDACLERASQADLVIKASGVGVFDEELEQAIARLRSPRRRTAFWDVDAPATLARLHRNPNDPLRHVLGQYDVVFTYGGGDAVQDAYVALGARRCEPIYNGVDPTTHFPVSSVARYRSDLSFLGNRLPDREERVGNFFLAAAEAMPEKSFLLAGSGWDDLRVPSNVRRIGFVPPKDHNAFNSSAGALLNVSRQDMADVGFSPATRVFEVAAAAGCLITDAWRGVDEFFEPGYEILVAQDAGDVVRYLHELGPEQRRRLGQAARERAFASHTYTRRAARVDAVMQAMRRTHQEVAHASSL